jgi:hypothetical protein
VLSNQSSLSKANARLMRSRHGTQSRLVMRADTIAGGEDRQRLARLSASQHFGLLVRCEESWPAKSHTGRLCPLPVFSGSRPDQLSLYRIPPSRRAP